MDLQKNFEEKYAQKQLLYFRPQPAAGDIRMKRKGYTQGALVDERKGLIKCTNFKRLQGQVFLFIDNMWYTNFICTKKQEKRPLGR